METVRAVRDEIERHVEALFDEIEETANERAAEKSLSKRVTDTLRSVIGSGS